MKKTISVILSIIMVFTTASFMAYAEDAVCSHENYTWVYEGADADYDCVNEEGLRYRVCDDCGERLDAVAESVPVQPEHRWIESSRDGACCIRPDESDKIPYVYYECTICDATKKVEQTYAGHAWGEWVVYVKCFEGANPASPGQYIRICAECDEAEFKLINNHTYVTLKGTAATCHREGREDYRRCVECGTVAPHEVIEKLPHVDADVNNRCDLCDGLITEGGNACRCLCHSEMGIVKDFLLPIVQILWKILGMNTCECGVVHC